jgi:hypothetical protein
VKDYYFKAMGFILHIGNNYLMVTILCHHCWVKIVEYGIVMNTSCHDNKYMPDGMCTWYLAICFKKYNTKNIEEPSNLQFSQTQEIVLEREGIF